MNGHSKLEPTDLRVKSMAAANIEFPGQSDFSRNQLKRQRQVPTQANFFTQINPFGTDWKLYLRNNNKNGEH